MALITLSGLPSSGKTRRANNLHGALTARLAEPSYTGPLKTVVHLSDDNLRVLRSSYDDAKSEKTARATLFTAAQRALAPDTVVILDGMNYIKGWRYQLYCAARESRIRTATIYIVAPPEQCREWNEARDMDETARYKLETLDNLIARFEEPSSMVRWDSPLFTVPWTDASLPIDDVWAAISNGVVKPPNAGTQAVPKAPTDALRTLEGTTSAIVSSLVAASGSSGALVISYSSDPGSTVRLALPGSGRTPTLSELQRHKRTFVTTHKKAITLGSTEKGAMDWTERAVAERFARYLEENIKP